MSITANDLNGADMNVLIQRRNELTFIFIEFDLENDVKRNEKLYFKTQNANKTDETINNAMLAT